MRVLIVDDEPLARRGLRHELERVPGIEIAGECANGREAVLAIVESNPDLVLLDVQMPGWSGFDVIERVGVEAMPPVIFVTAYDKHAVRAFEVHAVDYLLKPFGRERLAEALGRARDRLALATARAQDATPAASATALAASARGQGHFAERIVVRDGAQVHVIPSEQVDYVEAQDDYVAVHAAGHSHLKHQTLSELSETLDPERFVRVHRSYLVNVDRIARVELIAKDQRVIILRDGKQLPVSRSGHERLREQWS
jgi:two-component system LytT family response regulator